MLEIILLIMLPSLCVVTMVAGVVWIMTRDPPDPQDEDPDNQEL